MVGESGSPHCPFAKKEDSLISPLVAPRNNYLGVMLPYTPLHYLLLKDNFTALVMTSGNITDQPIIADNLEAMEKLDGIVDFFLPIIEIYLTAVMIL